MSSDGDARPDALSRQIMADTIEMLSHRILMESNRFERDGHERYQSIDYFFNALGERTKRHGRLYCRYRLAKIFAACCIQDPYPHPDYDKSSGFVALAKWDRDSWARLKTALIKLRGVLIRKDAEWLTGDSDEIHPVRGNEDSPLYVTQLNKVLRLIPIHQALSRFRWSIEEQVRSKKKGRPVVDLAVVAEFAAFVEENLEDDEQAQKALQQLLVHSERENTRSNGVSLVSLEELCDFLKVKPFSLIKFQKYLTGLLRNWALDIFGEAPALVRLGYHGHPRADSAAFNRLSQGGKEDGQESQIDDEEVLEDHDGDGEENSDDNEGPQYKTQPSDCARMPDADSVVDSAGSKSSRKRKAQTESAKWEISPLGVNSKLEILRSVRTTLQQDFDDPLEECRKVAASAVQVKRAPPESGSLRKKQARRRNTNDKKPSAAVIAFTDDEDDSEEEESVEEDNKTKLSELPDRVKTKTPRKPAGAVPDPPQLNEDGTRKRIRFTDDEKRAIREGVRKFGFGKWAMIKSEYAIILRNRTSVNIKDCYRTMMRNNEV